MLNKKRSPVDTKIKELTNGGHRTTGTAASVLGNMFWTIASVRNITSVDKWGILMQRYVDVYLTKESPDHRNISQQRGNLQKMLMKGEMTWKTFCKGMRFHSAVSFNIKITAKYANGKIEAYETNVILNDTTDNSLEEKDTDE